MITSRRFDFVREDWIKWGKGSLIALLPIILGAIALLTKEIDQSTFSGALMAMVLTQVAFWIKTWVSVHSYEAPDPVVPDAPLN